MSPPESAPPPPQQIRIQLSGRQTTLGSSIGEDGFSVVRVEVLGPPPAAAGRDVSSADTLAQLQRWLSGTAQAALRLERQQGGGGSASDSAAVAEAFDAAIHALASLARASGSLSGVLLLASALLSSPQRALSPRATSALSRLMHAVRLQVREGFTGGRGGARQGCTPCSGPGLCLLSHPHASVPLGLPP